MDLSERCETEIKNVKIWFSKMRNYFPKQATNELERGEGIEQSQHSQIANTVPESTKKGTGRKGTKRRVEAGCSGMSTINENDESECELGPYKLLRWGKMGAVYRIKN